MPRLPVYKNDAIIVPFGARIIKHKKRREKRRKYVKYVIKAAKSRRNSDKDGGVRVQSDGYCVRNLPRISDINIRPAYIAIESTIKVEA